MCARSSRYVSMYVTSRAPSPSCAVPAVPSSSCSAALLAPLPLAPLPLPLVLLSPFLSLLCLSFPSRSSSCPPPSFLPSFLPVLSVSCSAPVLPLLPRLLPSFLPSSLFVLSVSPAPPLCDAALALPALPSPSLLASVLPPGLMVTAAFHRLAQKSTLSQSSNANSLVSGEAVTEVIQGASVSSVSFRTKRSQPSLWIRA